MASGIETPKGRESPSAGEPVVYRDLVGAVASAGLHTQCPTVADTVKIVAAHSPNHSTEAYQSVAETASLVAARRILSSIAVMVATAALMGIIIGLSDKAGLGSRQPPCVFGAG